MSINGILIFIIYIIYKNKILCILEQVHNQNDKLKIRMGQLKSIITQLPLNYDRLGFCNSPNDKLINDHIGEILSGNKIRESNYEILINKNEFCKKLCTTTLSHESLDKFQWLLTHSYSLNLYLDNLPSALGKFDIYTKEISYLYNEGIPIGYSLNSYDEIFIYNHYTFKIDIHEVQKDKFEIVGFSIFPASIKQNDIFLGCKDTNNLTDYELRNIPQDLSEGDNITFTYDVYFQQSNLTMVSRWDKYLHLSSQIHWFGIINSNLIILIFTIIIILIICRQIKLDIDVYNIQVTGDDIIDEFGWKQVCNDVFRKPINSMFLSCFIGTGTQLFFMVFFSLIICIIGVIKPETRGNLVLILIIDFIIMGFLGGYISSRVYKMFYGKYWLKNALLTSTFYPCFIFLIFFLINLFFYLEKSDVTFNFYQIITFLFLWFCFSIPLVLLGSLLGIKKKIIKFPCRINPCPTKIPEKEWYFKIKYLIWLTGLIPFAAIFIEFLNLMTSLWRNQIYYLFGFLFIALLVLIIVSSEISIIICFFCLCKGDYNWWWKSFFIGGSVSIYTIIYSIYYFLYLNITRFSTFIIYFSVMTIISSIIFLICGSISVIFTFIFLYKIYSMIKID